MEVSKRTVVETESKSTLKPNHVPGTNEGNEMLRKNGLEPGRHRGGRSHRTARDSTSVRPEAEEPILPEMPNLPPA